MSNKKKACLVLLALGLFALTGCQLAREDAGPSAATARDRLIGVWITTEALDLFDAQGYLSDPISDIAHGKTILLDASAQGNARQGKLYATLATQPGEKKAAGDADAVAEYTFDGGIRYFAATMTDPNTGDTFIESSLDDGLCDAHLAISTGDEDDTLSLSGTVYLRPESGLSYYLNPVYQEGAAGRVYATAGSGISLRGVQGEGAVYAQTLEDSVTVTKGASVKTQRATVEIAFATLIAPERIAIAQFDASGVRLARTQYAPDALPERITPVQGAAYLVLEIWKTGPDGQPIATRTLHSPSDAALEVFTCRPDGLCIKRQVALSWAHAPEI